MALGPVAIHQLVRETSRNRAFHAILDVFQRPPQNIAGIETDGLDVTLNYRTGDTGLGRFGLYWTNTFLFNYRVAVPATNGVTIIDRDGTEQGSPDQAFPKWKSTAVLDWSMNDGFGASLTGRYIKGVDEANGNHLNSRLYTDLQLRWEPESWNGFGFALGANNLFDVDPPACFTCWSSATPSACICA